MKRFRFRTRDVDQLAPGIAPPGAPTIGTATAGNAQATVTFTAPGDIGGGPITGYRATSTPGGITGTAASSPITVTGLTNGVAYTFTVAAQNAGGFGSESAASNSVTPTAVTVTITNRANEFPTAAQTWNGFRFERAGTIIPDSNVGTGTRITNQWVSAGQSPTVGDGFEIRATLNAGTANGTTAAFGVWLALSADRTFALTTGGNYTVEIRPTGGSVVASAVYTITPI